MTKIVTAATRTAVGPPVIHIAAVNLSRREVVTDDGAVYPITNLYDANLTEVDDASAAKLAVAGTGGTWVTFALVDFETVTTQ